MTKCPRWPFWMSEKNFFFLLFYPLDVQISLSITFLSISDRYATFDIFDKMATVGHFGCLRLTFDNISGHFRSIRNLILFWNFIQIFVAVQKSISITLLAISDQYETVGCPKFTFDRISGHFRSIRNINFNNFFFTKWRASPFWMSEIHFRWHFWPFRRRTRTRLRCWQKHNIHGNLRFSGI